MTRCEKEQTRARAEMDFEHTHANPNHDDVKSLVNELNFALSKITMDSGEGSFSSENFNPALDGCIVVYCNSTAVACGIFRHHTSTVCELKRMYSNLPSAGSYLLKQLEASAISKGYQSAILSTRRVNTQAVNFYIKNAYRESEAYGKYVGLEKSICFRKTLSN